MSRDVLLLHGQPGSARDWEPLIAALGEEVAPLAIDRPGWGRGGPGADRPRERAGGLEHNATAALAALDAAGVERATVVGLSFGGAVAAWLAAAAPTRVGALVLVSPAANVASLAAIDRLLAAPVAGYVASAALLSGAGLALGVGRVRRYFSSTYALPEDYLRASGRRFRERSAWEAFVVEQRALLDDLPVLESRLEEITVPTTVVIGTRDSIVPPAAGHRLREQIAGAELVEIEGGRHVLPAEHPERIAELVRSAAAAAARLPASAPARPSAARA